jgi:hypothetical protein
MHERGTNKTEGQTTENWILYKMYFVIVMSPTVPSVTCEVDFSSYGVDCPD